MNRARAALGVEVAPARRLAVARSPAVALLSQMQRRVRVQRVEREHIHIDVGRRRQREDVVVVDGAVRPAVRPRPRVVNARRRRDRPEVFAAGVGGERRQRRYRGGRDAERERARDFGLGGGRFDNISPRAQNPLDSRRARRQPAVGGRVLLDEFGSERGAAPRQIHSRVGDGGIQLYRHQLGRRQRKRVMLGVAVMDSRGAA